MNAKQSELSHLYDVKKPTCDASQKGNKRRKLVTGLFSYIPLKITFIFFYPKCDKVVTGSEIGRFGEDDEKC